MLASIGPDKKEKHQELKEEKVKNSFGQNATAKTSTHEIRSKLVDILLRLADELKSANESQKKAFISKFAKDVVVLTSKKDNHFGVKDLMQQSKLEEQIIQATTDTLAKSEMAYKAFEAALWLLEEDEGAIQKYIHAKQQARAAEQHFEKLIDGLI